MLINLILSTFGVVIFLFGILIIINAFQDTNENTCKKRFFVAFALLIIGIFVIKIFDTGMPVVDIIRALN